MRDNKVSNSKSDLQGYHSLYGSINVKKLQFIHTVNGDGSKTAKIINRQC